VANIAIVEERTKLLASMTSALLFEKSIFCNSNNLF